MTTEDISRREFLRSIFRYTLLAATAALLGANIKNHIDRRDCPVDGEAVRPENCFECTFQGKCYTANLKNGNEKSNR